MGDAPITWAFVGDVMLGRGVAQALDGDWENAWSGVQPWLAGADWGMANLESPLVTLATERPAESSEDQAPYDLRAPTEAVAALRAAGFDVVSLANNHALDASEAGLAQTIAVLDGVGIVGLEARQTFEFPGGRLLALDDSVAPLDLPSAVRQIERAAEEGGAVLISIHWGGEYQAAPGPRQRMVARTLVAAGADLIIGHGPHVLQPVEWVDGALVAYSLGNFLFDQPYPVDCRWGAVLRVTLRGERVVAIAAVPTIAERGRVRLAAPADRAAILERLNLQSRTH